MYIFHSILILPEADVVRLSSLKRRLRSRRLTCFLPRVPEHNSNVALTRGSMSHDSGHSCLTTLGEALKSTYTNVLPCPVILLPHSLSLPNHTILQSSLERECQNVTMLHSAAHTQPLSKTSPGHVTPLCLPQQQQSPRHHRFL